MTARLQPGTLHAGGQVIGDTPAMVAVPTESAKYIAAMLRGDTDGAYRLERKHGLDGYPPELVSVGLQAIDAGEDAQEAIDAYIAPERQPGREEDHR